MLTISIEEKLKAETDGQVFVQKLNEIKKFAEPLLSKIVDTFPEYTSHDITHCERILEKFNLIIPTSLENKLNSYEIYFLIASTYLHDIGMVNLPEFNIKFTDEQEIKEYIRKNHHLRSENFCLNNFKPLEIDEHQARIIGRICRGHRRENLHDIQLFKPETMYTSYSINIPLLASLLKIGDELDLTFERTPQIIYEKITLKDDITKEEWGKHFSIPGVGLSLKDPLTINCDSNCKKPKIHRSLKLLETKINNQIGDLPNHLHQYRDCRKDIPRKFLMKIEPVGYTPYDFKFSLQEKEIITLLMGEKLYNRKEESIRELLKNSLDACRLRKSSLEKSGLSYTPTITFEQTTDINKLIVIDDGIGMDEEVIERYFTKIGQSLYKSPEFLEKHFDFTPVNELGIGILSCFMIANKIEVETKMDDSNSLLIEIDDVSDYFFIKEGTKKETGTTVTLFLKEDAKEIDLLREIRLYAYHLKLPVKVILHNGKEYIIKNEGFNPDISVDKYTDKYNLHNIKIDYEFAEGIIGILSQKNELMGFKPIDVREWELPEGLKEKLGKSYLSNEGIYVDNTDVIPKWLNSKLTFTDLNLKTNILDLNVARNSVIQNEKFNNFKNRIEEILLENISEFFSQLEHNMETEDFKKYTKLFFSNYVNFNSSDKLSDKFKNFLKQFFYFKTISKDGFVFLNYYEIFESGKQPICFSSPYYSSDDFIQLIISKCVGFNEHNTYIIQKYNNSLFVDFLFSGVNSTSLLNLIDFEESNELNGIIPKAWKLVKIKNYNSSKFIEFSDWNSTYLNKDHIFVELLIKNKHKIGTDKSMAILGIFRTLKNDLNSDFRRLLEKQQQILKWLVDLQIINEDEINKYLLTIDDFP